MKVRLMDEAMLYHIVFVLLFVPAYVRAISVAPDGGEAADKNICKDPKCKKLAKMIKNQMGEKEPCVDFHNYVCGKWKGDLELNETIIKKKAVLTLASLLKNASAPYIKDSNATDKLIHAYHSCTSNGKGKKKEMLRMSIERVIKQYNLTEWPIIEKNGRSPPLSSSDDYVDVLKKIGPRPVFSYSIIEESSGPVISMTKPWEFDVFENQEFPLLDSRSDSTSETEGSTESPNYDQYDENLKNDEEAYKTFIKKTIHLLNESVSEQEMVDVAEGIVKIEKGLAKWAMGASGKDELRVNISQLDELVGHGFTMAPILKRDFEGLNIDIDEKTEVVVQYIDYYQEVVNFLRCTTTVELTNYALWTKIRKMAEATGTPLNKIYLEYKHNTSSPVFTYADNSSVSIKLRCMRQLLETGVMYTAGAHYYVKAKFNENFRKDVLKMLEFVNSSFMYVVKHNTWMSDHTKDEAIARLHTMDAVIGYPDWMLNETILNTVYRFVPDIEKDASFAEHYHFLLENEHKQTLLKLEPGMYFDKVKETVTLRSHAYYVDASNSLVYPAAALVTHYRWHPIPRSSNFGTIGTILGQLFATSIERYSHKSQETGQYTKDNWDLETAKRFCEKSSCLNHTEECNDTSPSGSNKHEKFRDYLGLRISYEAMKNSTTNYTPTFVLPDGDNFDSESKIFFLLFGSLYCPYSVNKQPVEARSSDETRSADETRYHDSLNEIVYTYIEFNKTFKCPEIQGADTCHLMPPSGPAPLPNC